MAALLVMALAGAVVVGAVPLVAPPPGSSDPGVGSREEVGAATSALPPERVSSPERTGPPPSAPPAAGARATPLTRSEPVRLRIPALGVDTDLTALGLQADGALEVPTAGFPAGWFTGAPTPGELGPAIVAGHVDWAGSPGVFYDLRRLAVGDEVTVLRQDSTSVTFRVTRVQRFPKDRFPTDLVYGDIDHAGLRLITCAGSFDRRARSYVDNLVVFAELVGSSRV